MICRPRVDIVVAVLDTLAAIRLAGDIAHLPHVEELQSALIRPATCGPFLFRSLYLSRRVLGGPSVFARSAVAAPIVGAALVEQRSVPLANR